MKKLTPYQKIVRAAKRGGGCRLTPQDCYDLTFDDAITTRAGLDDEGANRDGRSETDLEKELASDFDPN